MATGRTLGGGGRKAPKAAARVDAAEYSLPDEPKPIDTDLRHYSILVYAREKWGKTNFFSSFPECMFLMTEPGAKGLSIYEFNHEKGGVRDWDDFRAAVKLLSESDRFENVVIDTVDRAYDMCRDWVCNTLNIPYPGEEESGKEDRGKSWTFVKQEFVAQIDKLLRTGRGLHFTSHSKSAEIKTRTGDKYDRVYPSMSGQARGVVEALVDMFFYGEYFKDDHGHPVRALVTRGDEAVWAGHRSIAGMKPLPTFLPVKEGKGYETLLGALKGEVAGIEPMDINKSKSTAPATSEFLLKARQTQLRKNTQPVQAATRKATRRVVGK